MDREEAIRTVRLCCPKISNSECDFETAMRVLIPELRESEDERIRKWLYDYIERVGDTWGKPGPFDYTQILAWLEKQKEQKPTATINGEPIPTENHSVDIPLAEWGEEDTEMYINVASSLRGYACGFENEEHKRHIKKELDWLENRFKSLRPSWKPSEQEKGALRTAIHILTDERSFPKAAAHLQDILNAFEGKESRKDWKPSEEQMNILKAVKEYVGRGSGYWGEGLSSLIEDLEKLM